MTSKKKDAVPPATSANPDQKKSRHPELRLAVNRGWRLIPIRSGEKRPFLKGWPELATTDVNQIKSWLKQYPQCNWGVATGAASNLLVLDVDSDEALESAKQFGELPKTFTVKTANGYHFYFQFPTKASARNSASVIAEGLDVRGEGDLPAYPIGRGIRRTWRFRISEICKAVAARR